MWITRRKEVLPTSDDDVKEKDKASNEEDEIDEIKATISKDFGKSKWIFFVVDDDVFSRIIDCIQNAHVIDFTLKSRNGKNFNAD